MTLTLKLVETMIEHKLKVNTPYIVTLVQIYYLCLCKWRTNNNEDLFWPQDYPERNPEGTWMRRYMSSESDRWYCHVITTCLIYSCNRC